MLSNINLEITMDRVTKSFVSDFIDSFGFDSTIDDPTAFEHFVNYSIIEPKTEYRFDVERINIGKDGTIGIDGFALLLNRQYIDNTDELEDFLSGHKKCTAEVIFIQSKTSPKFNSKDIGNFGFAVSDFIAETQKLTWSRIAHEKIGLFNAFVNKISELAENPVCSLYYVTLGKKTDDNNINAKVDSTIDDIESENLFSKIDLHLIGSIEIQSLYKKIGQAITKSFEFPDRVALPVINEVKESYIGVVNTETIIRLMTDDRGQLLSNVFYDNVRDFQGDIKVNNEIASTINSENKDSFAILNNGITIVAEDLQTTRNTFTISNYQIINGCQTSHVLFENRELLDATVKVPIKLVVSKNDDLTSRVIRSTNRQTAVKEQDLIAFSNFQKRLEDYYASFTGQDKLYYERRSKQYNNKDIEKKRIIDKTTQIKAIGSLYYDKPELATRYFGTLFNEFGDKLFKDDHDMYPYYVASYAIYKIDSLFRVNKIDKRYKKIKYHLLMLIRHEINNNRCPNFGNKKSKEYFDDILNLFKNDNDLLKIIKKIINRINKYDFDFDDNEISKSREFVEKCLDYYRPTK